MEADPPIINSSIFNDSYFTDLEGNLTLATADLRYVKKQNGIANSLLVNGLTINNNLTLNGTQILSTATELNYLSGVSAGTGLSNKALILDSSKNINNINLLSCTSLKLNNILVNSSATELNYLSGVSPGLTVANKALVVDSGRNITGVQGLCLGSSTDTSRYLSLLVNALPVGNTLYGLTYGVDNSPNNQSEFAFYYNGNNSTGNALSFGFYGNSGILKINADQTVDIAFHNGTTGLKLGGTLVTATAAEINYLDINSTGVAQSSKAVVLNGSKEIYDMGGLSFSPNQTNRVLIKRSDTGHGVYLYDTQNTVSNTPYATLSMLCANQTAPTYMLFDCAFATNPYTISYKDGSAFTSGLKISCNNTTQASNVNSNVMLAARNGTIPHVVVNDSQNQLHLFPQGLAELNTAYAQNVIIGEELLVRKSLCVGTSQDVGRLISALDSTQTTGTKKYITLGRTNLSNNQAEIYFHYDSTASDTSYLGFGHFGKADILTVGGNGWVGINTNSPLAPLHVNSTTSIAYGVPFNTVYRLRTDNGNTESATGPISYNTSAVFNGYIACTAMAMSSDKRLKENIKDVSFEHVDNFYRTMTPKTYNFKNNKTKIEYGFVAQEVVRAGYLDLISMIGNEDLKGVVEDPEVDIDGVQLCIDYQKITMFNMRMIQNLIKEINILKDIVDKLVSKPALSKWLQRSP